MKRLVFLAVITVAIVATSCTYVEDVNPNTERSSEIIWGETSDFDEFYKPRLIVEEVNAENNFQYHQYFEFPLDFNKNGTIDFTLKGYFFYPSASDAYPVHSIYFGVHMVGHNGNTIASKPVRAVDLCTIKVPVAAALTQPAAYMSNKLVIWSDEVSFWSHEVYPYKSCSVTQPYMPYDEVRYVAVKFTDQGRKYRGFMSISAEDIELAMSGLPSSGIWTIHKCAYASEVGIHS